MSKAIKNICIYGVGRVGGYFGAKLIAANEDKNYKISFIARGEHLKAIKDKGIILETNNTKINSFPDFATDNISEVEEIDLLILCVKSYDLNEAIKNLKDKIKEGTIILPLLNGVDIYERIKAELKNAIVLPSCVYVGTHIKEPGVISQNGGDGKIIFGNDPGCSSYYPENVIKCFEALNINFKYEKNPYKEIWTKYMFISALGLVTAVTGKSLGEVLENKELVQDVRGIMEEVKQLAKAKGISLDEKVVEESISKGRKFPYNTRTSYQRDVESKNKRNEGEIFGGTIIKMGKQYNLKTIATEKYYKQLNNIDNSTAHASTEYDGQINNTIPYYECFHKETINFVKAAKNNPGVWLDTGCGTGTLVEQAAKCFDNTLFILADPSIGMLNIAKDKLVDFSEDKIKFLSPASTQELNLVDFVRPDVITSIQAHHYLSMEDRVKATAKCHDLLNENGIYITFENICPLTQKGIEMGKEYWKQYQITCGKSTEAAAKHMKRFGVEYFPITIQEHLNLLKDCGFRAVELFWYSYMQAGFYCIK